MTSNRDPNLDRSRLRRRPHDYVRREDGSWNALPILLGLALVLGLGYMFFLSDWNARTNEPLTKRSEAPVTGPMTTPPTTSPPGTAPKQ